jgi:hypothetical protein
LPWKATVTVCRKKGVWTQPQQLKIPEQGQEVWLKSLSKVKLFRTRLKDKLRHYATHLPDNGPPSAFRRGEQRSPNCMSSIDRLSNITLPLNRPVMSNGFRCSAWAPQKTIPLPPFEAMSSCRNCRLRRLPAIAIGYNGICLMKSCFIYW